MGQRIAIVGTGISGLGAAWALYRDNDITVFEADNRIGGHSNTVDVETPNGPLAVDTGFIVYNEVTYPNLTRLFSSLGVSTEPSDMSFAFSLDRRFEYGASLGGVLARPGNLLLPRFLRMLRDINRFRRIGTTLEPGDGETIGELLERYGFSRGFLDDYLYPMTGAIWSARQSEISRFPAASILRFLANHGLIEIVGRPRWRTVTGGSRSYLNRLVKPFADRIRTSSPVDRLVRLGGEVLVESNGQTQSFDQVILATHPDQALAILGEEATDTECALLGGVRYESNVAVLHSDPSLMPRNRRVWSSWNAMAEDASRPHQVASVTYWMNRLQNLDPSFPLFVSLNPLREPDPGQVHARFAYAHAQFDLESVAAQQGLAAIQGLSNTWYAGAYLGYGFHEDGLQSGLNVAAALGSPAPWHGTFEPVSSAPSFTERVVTP
jgi:predicted NAD/FAD-binding protein